MLVLNIIKFYHELIVFFYQYLLLPFLLLSLFLSSQSIALLLYHLCLHTPNLHYFVAVKKKNWC